MKNFIILDKLYTCRVNFCHLEKLRRPIWQVNDLSLPKANG